MITVVQTALKQHIPEATHYKGYTRRYKNKTIKYVAICHPVCIFWHKPGLIVIFIFNKAKRQLHLKS